MSELTRPERMRAALLNDAEKFVVLATEHLSQGDWHNSFCFSTVAVGYCERYNGNKAVARRVEQATSIPFSLHTMLEGQNHPGNTVIQCPGDPTEVQAKVALSIAEEYWSEIGLGVVRIISPLGNGGYGIVEHLLLRDGTETARKTFRAENFDAPSLENAKVRFRREVRAQQQLQEIRTRGGAPVALPVLRTSLDGQHLWFTMPLARRHLRPALTELKCDHMRRNELVCAAEPLVMSIIDLVDVVHANGMVHRDLKPENILEWEESWVLADFGLCILAGSTSRMTSTGRALGTDGYLAPEQYHSARTATQQADIYSLGCIIDDLFGHGYRVPYGQVLDCPGAIGEVVKTCTEIDPSRRYATIADLRDALEQAIQSEITC